MQTRKLGPLEVSAISFGCMTLSHAYGIPPSSDIGARILNEALDANNFEFENYRSPKPAIKPSARRPRLISNNKSALLLTA